MPKDYSEFTEKYRPQKPAQLIGKSQVKAAKGLIKSIDEGKPFRQLFLDGPSGSGKTTISLMYIQRLLNTKEVGKAIVNVNCGTDTGIDVMRERIIRTMHYEPMPPYNYRVYFLNEVHGLSTQAQNSLLDEIEPLPDHVVIIANTTDPQKVIKTLKSRFSRLTLSSPSAADFYQLANWIWTAQEREGKKEKPQGEVLDDMIFLSEGNIRSFMQYLDQFYAGIYVGGTVEETKDLLKVMLYENPPLYDLLKLCDSISDFNGALHRMVAYCTSILKNPKSEIGVITRAGTVVMVFGEGLPMSVSPRLGFIKRLVEYNQSIME
jgi:replication-associated recombination protein RarA